MPSLHKRCDELLELPGPLRHRQRPGRRRVQSDFHIQNGRCRRGPHRTCRRGRKYQFAFLDDDADMATPFEVDYATASERGSGQTGLTGTIPKSTVAQNQGLAHVSSAGLDEAPQESMLPNTWAP